MRSDREGRTAPGAGAGPDPPAEPVKTADPADSRQANASSGAAGPQSEIPATGRITGFLSSWRKGSPEAPGRLFELVYQELHALAHRQLGRGPRGGTLSTTTLVHEAYLKLGDHERLELHDRGHFFALAARAMRQIVLDGARRHAADKRGGGLRRIELEDGKIACEERATEILALDAALEKLEALDPRLAAVVELRFYGGLSVEETAEALGSSPRTVKRDWQKARAYLFRELSPTGSG